MGRVGDLRDADDGLELGLVRDADGGSSGGTSGMRKVGRVEARPRLGQGLTRAQRNVQTGDR